MFKSANFSMHSSVHFSKHASSIFLQTFVAFLIDGCGVQHLSSPVCNSHRQEPQAYPFFMDGFVQRIQALRIGGKYQLVRLIGEGSWGKVYLGQDVSTQSEVAMKLEHYSVPEPFLDQEIEAYELLKSKPGFPRVFWHGRHDTFQIMVFELLGPNLEDLFCYCGQKFSLKTTLMLADQLLHRFQALNDIQYIHRDIKPENFMLGCGVNGNTVYLTDLGLAFCHGRYPSTSSEVREAAKDRDMIKDSRMIGTCHFASIDGHLGCPNNARDDLEALGYMLIYFMKGSLPWEVSGAANRLEKYKKVYEIKTATTSQALCEGLPSAFLEYMTYVRSSDEIESPDYGYLRRLFSQLFAQQGFEYDNVFDWTILEFYRLQQEATD